MRSSLLSRHLRIINATTLVAILVVSAGLLVPWILKVQEASNKEQCASNLRALGVAAHNYHASWQKLPPGYYGPFRGNAPTNVVPAEALDRGPWVGCLGPLVPFLGYQRGEF